ncbi:DNA polymerase III [Deinococcus detaillensis]|uniref:DNA polymerase III n=1 Tax=Deinococcus detaillensis TaxID=2592048 RepID=A0A553UUK4_9DEIO|nr:DNA polymerase III [Deinococcus detaillensis]TSA83882.1 DNA polymerase III [Deinococcus detaillensis]
MTLAPPRLPRLPDAHAALLPPLAQTQSNAWLLTGPARVGKRALASVVAALHNCAQRGPQEAPCGECASCRAAALGLHPDVLVLAPRTITSTGKAARRKIIPIGAVLASRDRDKDYEQHVYEFLEVRPTYRRRVVIIDGAEHLNAETANALLKLIEEPPHRALFVLLAEDVRSVLPTLVSRSSRLGVPPAPQSDLAKYLQQEGCAVDAELLAFAAGRAGLLSDVEAVRSALSDARTLTDAVREGLWPAFEAAAALEKTFSAALHPEALRFVWQPEAGAVRAAADTALEALQGALEAYANPGLSFQVFALSLRQAFGAA